MSVEILSLFLSRLGDKLGKQLTCEQSRFLALCGQVCRPWAALCRPHLFRSIRLRSAEDVSSFSAILRAPPVAELEPITEHIEHITLEVNLDHRPWLHHFEEDVRLPISKGIAYSLEVLGMPESYEDSALNRPYPVPFNTLLPISLPGPYSLINNLVLDNVTFRDAAKLCVFLGKLPLVGEIWLNNVCWDIRPSPETTDPPPQGLLRTPTSSIYAEGRDSQRTILWLVPAIAEANFDTVPPPGECAALVRLLESLTIDGKTTEQTIDAEPGSACLFIRPV